MGLVSIGGYFLESAEVQETLHDFIVGTLPISANFVTENIASLVRLRGPVGLASLAMLMWSASKMVGSLSRGINNALDLKRPYAFYLSRLRNFLLTVTVSIVVFASITIAIEIGKVLFGYYYASVSSNDLIYGSLSSVIVLLLWLYFCGRSVLYGSQVIFVYRQSRQAQINQNAENHNTCATAQATLNSAKTALQLPAGLYFKEGLIIFVFSQGLPQFQARLDS